VGGDLRNPVQDREQGKVSLEVRVHLGAIEHGLGIFPVGHLLLRERGTQDILGQALPSMTVVTLDLDLIVNTEAGVSPGEELVDQFSADLIFPEQHLKDLVAEEVFQFPYVYFRKDVKPPVRHKAAVGDEAMEVGVEVDQITEGLDRDDGSGYAFRPVQGRAEKLFEALIGALAELSQEFPIESKIGPQHFGNRKHILPMG